MLGFTTYTDNSQTTPPDLRTVLAGMTGAQKIAVLDAFQDKKGLTAAKHTTGQPVFVIAMLYGLFEDTELTCRQYMRGEVVVTPGDPTADPPVEPEYNTPPTTITQLKNTVAPLMVAKYDEAFTEIQIKVVIDRVVQSAVIDTGGNYTGTFATYKTGVTE